MDFKSAFKNARLGFARLISGDYSYSGNSISDLQGLFSSSSFSNLEIAQSHPILTPAILFVSKLYSQVQFEIINKRTGKKVTKHPLLDLLKRPNMYQTGIDFQESLMFMMIASGKAVVYKKKTIGFKSDSDTECLYLLNPELLKFPDGFNTKMLGRSNIEDSAINNMIVKYDENGENLDIRIGDLLFFYDLPNMLNKNFYETKSRIDGLKQTLINTNDSLTAKNIILKTNGKELLSGGSGAHAHPLTPAEKDEMQKRWNLGYGLSRLRSRVFITKASVDYKSLHIALRDLGLDESVKVDGNIIYTALHIPKDILSLEAKKTTYNNFKESMVSYIQNEMQSSADAVAKVLQLMISEPNLEVRGSYDHLPVMQFYLMQRYEALSKKAQALEDLLNVGIPQENALEECGYDRNLKLNPRQPISNNGQQQNNQSQSTQEGEGQEDS